MGSLWGSPILLYPIPWSLKAWDPSFRAQGKPKRLAHEERSGHRFVGWFYRFQLRKSLLRSGLGLWVATHGHSKSKDGPQRKVCLLRSCRASSCCAQTYEFYLSKFRLAANYVRRQANANRTAQPEAELFHCERVRVQRILYGLSFRRNLDLTPGPQVQVSSQHAVWWLSRQCSYRRAMAKEQFLALLHVHLFENLRQYPPSRLIPESEPKYSTWIPKHFQPHSSEAAQSGNLPQVSRDALIFRGGSQQLVNIKVLIIWTAPQKRYSPFRESPQIARVDATNNWAPGQDRHRRAWLGLLDCLLRCMSQLPWA